MAVRRDDSVWCALRVFCAQGEADHASEGEGRGEDSEGQKPTKSGVELVKMAILARRISRS